MPDTSKTHNFPYQVEFPNITRKSTEGEGSEKPMQSKETFKFCKTKENSRESTEKLLTEMPFYSIFNNFLSKPLKSNK